MAKMRKRWWEVANTDEEKKLFIFLARHPKFTWRSVASIMRELRITPEELEALVEPYRRAGMIVASVKRDGVYLAYWERLEDGEDGSAGG